MLAILHTNVLDMRKSQQTCYIYRGRWRCIP